MVSKSVSSKILKNIEELRGIVSGLSTVSIIGTVAAELRKPGKARKLRAPLKQSFYLLGLMLTTKEQEQEIHLDNHAYSKIIKLLNDIFDAYGFLYWSMEKEENPNAYKYGKVALPTFLHYFTTGLLASVEQVKRRIENYISPFDEFITNKLGLSSKQFIEITDEIIDLQEQKYIHLTRLFQQIEKNKLGGPNSKSNLTSEQISLMSEIVTSIDELFEFDVKDIAKVSNKALEYLDFLASTRDASISFTYITDSNPAERRPIFKNKKGKYLCPAINSLYTAILLGLENLLQTSEQKEKYFKNRDMRLEQETFIAFNNFFGNGAVYYTNIFESIDLQHEHDCVIVGQENLYIIEAKASPPIEPFRDPEKAFVRLKRQFQSDRGIQKSFDQANRLRQKLLTEKIVTMYDERRRPIVLDTQGIDNIFCICVTRDDYGPLATSLDLLLEKPDISPYPWVINILALEAFIQGFNHLKLVEKNFCEYLKQRCLLHGKVFGTDELEYAGYYIQHKNFNDMLRLQADLVTLSFDYSDIFDDIYIADHLGEKIAVPHTPPYLINFKQEIIEAVKTNSAKKSQTLRRKKEKNKLRTEKRSRRRNPHK